MTAESQRMNATCYLITIFSKTPPWLVFRLQILPEDLFIYLAPVLCRYRDHLFCFFAFRLSMCLQWSIAQAVLLHPPWKSCYGKKTWKNARIWPLQLLWSSLPQVSRWATIACPALQHHGNVTHQRMLLREWRQWVLVLTISTLMAIPCPRSPS